MRHTDVIIRETCDQNRQTFNNQDRTAARTAWDIYMSEINGMGLRCEFDYSPHNVGSVLRRAPRHRRELGDLKARAKRFEKFIELLETLGGRSAVQLNPLWWDKADAAETITRTLDPQAVRAYKAFHAALVAYLDELGKESPDWSKVSELVRRVACTVNPEAWQEAGAPASGRGVTDFGTRWLLEAILAEPQPAVSAV